MTKISGYETNYTIPVVTGYVGYFVLGYLLADVTLNRRGKIIGLFAILGCIIAIAIGTYLLIL